MSKHADNKPLAKFHNGWINHSLETKICMVLHSVNNMISGYLERVITWLQTQQLYRTELWEWNAPHKVFAFVAKLCPTNLRTIRGRSFLISSKQIPLYKIHKLKRSCYYVLISITLTRNGGKMKVTMIQVNFQLF